MPVTTAAATNAASAKSNALKAFYDHASLEAIEAQPKPFAMANLTNSDGVLNTNIGVDWIGTAGNDVIVPPDPLSYSQIYGGAGDDLIFATRSSLVWGGEGADTMVALVPLAMVNFSVDNVNDRVIVGGDVQTAWITSSVDFTLPENVVGGVAFNESALVTLTGNRMDNAMVTTGNFGGGALYGMGGNDFLRASINYGENILDGGVGNDFLETYGVAQSTFTGGEGQDIFSMRGIPTPYREPTVITDFSNTDDTMQAELFTFTLFSPNTTITRDTTGEELHAMGYLTFNSSTKDLRWDFTPEDTTNADNHAFATLVGVSEFDYANFTLF